MSRLVDRRPAVSAPVLRVLGAVVLAVMAGVRAQETSPREPVRSR